MNPWRSIDRQATVVATGVGAATILAVRIGMALESGEGVVYSDLFLALVAVGAFCTLLFYKLISHGARAIDAATDRLLQAAHGDLKSPISPMVTKRLPDLSVAMESLFSQTRTNLENVQTLAMFDAVTGLANRTNFCRQVERLLAEREINGPAAMFFIDLDGFKAINDTLGHAAGDHILTRVAGRLREVAIMQARAGVGDAVIGRLAGDEFTMFFPSMPPDTSAMRVARAVQYALGEPFDIGGTQAEVGASIGVAYYPEHGATLAALLRSADHAMYDAKNAGRGQVQLYSRDMELRIAGKAEMERELRRALDHNEFLLEFQPQIDIVSGTVVGAEALVRWAHPKRDLIMPDAFVSLAEETGMIVELGDWIMNHVCETASRWAAAGVRHRLSINISRRELTQPDFFIRLAAIMARHGTPPDMIELELTETLSMKLGQDVIDALIELRQQGVRVAIDDFGTGFSNLARLRDLPVDRVKIDRSLVRDIAVSEEARVICSAVVGLVQGLGLDIVVEGVESEDQVNILRVMGCTIFQGFHLSRPIAESRYFEQFGDVDAREEIVSA
tara:strand:- start:85384 stop:87066 length:1683 start_codon:yes stop_codon:yes gene_type:complete